MRGLPLRAALRPHWVPRILRSVLPASRERRARRSAPSGRVEGDPMTAVERLVDFVLDEHVPHRTFSDSPPTSWCAACSPTVLWPCRFARLADEARAEYASEEVPR